MEKNINSNKVNYLSLASVISAFAVVMLHTNGCFWTFSKERYWITANVIESVMYFAVPVFFMISGATLIDYRERYTTKQFVVKRLKKTLIPFIAWSVIGVVYMVATDYWGMEWTLEWFNSVWLRIININVISIYWFFGALFSVYLCIPVLSAISKELRNKVFIYIIVAVFVIDSLAPFLCRVFSIEYASKVTIPVGGGYIIYVLLGYILSKVSLSLKQYIMVYGMAIAGLIMHIVGTYCLSYNAGYIVQTFKGYLNVPCILYSVGVFVLFKQLGEKIKNQRVIDLIDWVSQYTFAVYLLHWFVMNVIVRKFYVDIRSMWYRLGAPIIIFAICIMITWIVRRIPILKKILP